MVTAKLKIFISYSRSDMAMADALVDALEAADFAVQIDRRDLPYGEQWQQVLYEYIRDCDTVVFLVSERSIESQWVRWELQQVTELRKRLVPVLLAPCPPELLPPAIARVEVLPKAGTFTIAGHASQLIQALNTDRVWVMQATKLQSRTLDWIAAGRATALLLRGAALDAAEQWRSLKPKVETISGDVLDFVLSSRQQATHRQRYWAIASLVVAVVTSALAITAYWQWGVATRRGEEARLQTIEAQRQANAALAQSAAVTSLASDNDPARGLLLAREALRRSENKPTVTMIAAHRNAVVRFGPAPLLEAGRRGLSLIEGFTDAPFPRETLSALAVSTNGRWVVAALEEQGRWELWRFDLENQDPASTVRVLDTGVAAGGATNITVAISASGRFAAAAPLYGDEFGPGARVFELHDDGSYRTRLAKWSEDRPEHGVLIFSGDEKHLAHGNHIWRLADTRESLQPLLLPLSDPGASPFFSPDSTRIGVVALEGERIAVRTWDTATARDERRAFVESLAALIEAHPNASLELPSEEMLHWLASPNGKWEIAWRKDFYGDSWLPSHPVIRNFDANGRPNRRELPRLEPSGAGAASENGEVRDAAFSANGRWLTTIGDSLLLWDLEAKDPFAKPYLNFSTAGHRVAIDASGRWLVSFGTRLQIWDLALEDPTAFPIEPNSVLEPIAAAGGVEKDRIRFRFVGRESWLMVDAEGGLIKGRTAEFWDLRFDHLQSDGHLSRRNLTEGEWRSIFGETPRRKTFPDQPWDPEAMRAADALAREGKTADAITAYKRIFTDDPDVTFDAERRAARLAAAVYWTQGEEALWSGKLDVAAKLLRDAKQLNPQIPWNPAARIRQRR